jgi:hypothetical protein
MFGRAEARKIRRSEKPEARSWELGAKSVERSAGSKGSSTF